MITIHTIAQAFTPAECDLLAQLAQSAPAQDAKLVKQAADHNIRRSELVWLDDIAGADWVMDRIINVVRDANRAVYNFDLTAFSESAQIARYGSERQGHFDWHSDIGHGPLAGKRKLTIVAQISDPQDYDGGALEIMASTAVTTAPRDRGAATVFPSYLLHRVTPVTQGQRQSLTVWAHGPAFR